jgi:hypothetical protein
MNPNAQQRIQEAKDLANKVFEIRFSEVKENVQGFRQFHNSLALMAGGTLALSVTYLGYLKNAHAAIACVVILKLCWAVLIICLSCAVFYVDFNIKYLHHARAGEYAQRLIDLNQIQLEELDSFGGVIDAAGSRVPKNVQAATFKDNIRSLTKDRDWTKKKEDRYAKLYATCGYAARYGFVLGLLLLIIFAIKNT